LSERLNEERLRSEEEYKRQIDKILVDISVLKNSYLEFSDSGILNTNHKREFVISLFVGTIFKAKMTRLYKATKDGF
jgi:hypothetical protein